MKLVPVSEGRQILADGVVMGCGRFEKIVVNSVEFTVSSSLAALRSGCTWRSHLRLGSLSALARPTPYQLSHRVAS